MNNEYLPQRRKERKDENLNQRARFRAFFFPLFSLFLLGLWSCPKPQPVVSASNLPQYKFAVAEVVVTKSAICPVCLRPVFNCEVKDSAREEFFEGLSMALAKKGFGMVKLSLAEASAEDKKKPESWLPLARKVKSDYLLLPAIYCWSERKGSAVASSSPAEVGFHEHIYETASGKEVWGGNFNEKQAPLSANLLDLQEFLKRHGQWIKADDLGQEGSEKLLEEFLKVMAENAANTGH